jgi:hypothetical protein
MNSSFKPFENPMGLSFPSRLDSLDSSRAPSGGLRHWLRHLPGSRLLFPHLPQLTPPSCSATLACLLCGLSLLLGMTYHITSHTSLASAWARSTHLCGREHGRRLSMSIRAHLQAAAPLSPASCADSLCSPARPSIAHLALASSHSFACLLHSRMHDHICNALSMPLLGMGPACVSAPTSRGPIAPATTSRLTHRGWIGEYRSNLHHSHTTAGCLYYI